MRKFQKKTIPKPLIAPPPKWLMSLAVPKELEIGAGNGEFAIQRAKKVPNTHFIAIEKSRTRFNLMQKQCQKQSLPNLWVFHTNAVWWITHFVLKNSLNSVYILYPNPYIKARQKNLRWFNRPFMAYLLDCLKVGGTLEIRTNQQSYYEEAKQKMALYPHISQKQALSLTPNLAVDSKGTHLLSPPTCRSLKKPKGRGLAQRGNQRTHPQPLSPPTRGSTFVKHTTKAWHKSTTDSKGTQPLSPPTRGSTFVKHTTKAWHKSTTDSKGTQPLSPPTRGFERKYLARGEKCWSLVWTKLSSTGKICPPDDK